MRVPRVVWFTFSKSSLRLASASARRVQFCAAKEFDKILPGIVLGVEHIEFEASGSDAMEGHIAQMNFPSNVAKQLMR